MKINKGGGILKQIVRTTALIWALSVPAGVYALSVGEAKQAGLVSETGSGYLQATPAKRTPEVDRLVSQTNAARKTKYREIAKKLKVDLSVVEKDFGQKLRGR
jgi:uncharacterized protein YdbL (DUF1318 family)